MSLWGSTLVFDDDEPLGPPVVFRGSHLFPDPDDRGGSVSTAYLAAFLTRDGVDDGELDGTRWWPYLRLSLRSAQMTDDKWVEDTVILDVAQVDALIADLTAWRQGVNEDLR